MGGERVTLRDKWGNLAVTLSVKGLVFDETKIWLRKNEREDWELPGGRLNDNEQPEETIQREVLEELGRTVSNIKLIDVYVWEKDFGSTTHIGIITFSCDVESTVGDLELVGEAGKAEFRLFDVNEAKSLQNLPEVYKRAIYKYENH